MPPESKPRPPSVVLPVHLAEKLFACYYGSGPRHNQSPEAAVREIASEPATEPTPPHVPTRLEGDMFTGQPTLLSQNPPGFIPRGAAAAALRPPMKGTTNGR